MTKGPITFLVASIAAAAVACAGPEPISGKEMKQVAPVPAPECFNWTGFYIGGFGGYKRSNVDQDLGLAGGWNPVPNGQTLGETAGSGDLDNDGGEVGGLLGYNFQMNCWVFGAEVSGGYLWSRDSSASGAIVPTDTSTFNINSSFKTHYLVTVAPRIGYAFGRWLPYVTGGLALGDLEYFQDINFHNGPTAHEGGSKTETNAGWMVGGGLQYALTDHWSIRGQYQYIDLGDVSFTTDFSNPGGAPAHHRAALTEHNASVALMFKF